ncbi:MAG: sigma-70 family RNA polymerase sigma factor [Chitinophagaceae bacterium]|jgi:RNA polymerase sigma factor (sigma-70 family)|nr:sigma-70 family RNA polymerase sigma factor [Chitinophagaceae bacterium]MCU0404208.1 sigma-70 family RNA polymerase sigma factor [Chitinophagaceae bacterium]
MIDKDRNQLSDIEIISGLEGNDVTVTVEFLYAQYFKEIIEVVKYMGGSEEDGADVFQEAVLVMIEKIREKRFRGDSSVKTYLFGIVKNQWLMELRTRERRKKREEQYMSGEPYIQNTLEYKKSNADLNNLFNQLGEVCKRILVGFYFENKSMKALLDQFEFKNEQVLRNRKNSCMRKLKEILSTNKNLIQSLKSDFIYE